MDLYFLPQPSRPATSPPSRPTPFSQQEEDTSTPARYSLSIIPPPRKRIHRIKPIDPAASGLWTVPEEVHEGWSSYDQEQFEEIDLEERTTAWQTRAAQSSFFEDDNDDEEDFEGVEGEEESGGTTQEVDNNELSSLDISRPKTYLDDMLSTLFTEAGFSDTSTKPPSTLLDGFNFILPTSPPPPLPSSPPPHSRHPFATSSPLVNPPTKKPTPLNFIDPSSFPLPPTSPPPLSSASSSSHWTSPSSSSYASPRTPSTPWRDQSDDETLRTPPSPSRDLFAERDFDEDEPTRLRSNASSTLAKRSSSSSFHLPSFGISNSPPPPRPSSRSKHTSTPPPTSKPHPFASQSSPSSNRGPSLNRPASVAPNPPTDFLPFRAAPSPPSSPTRSPSVRSSTSSRSSSSSRSSTSSSSSSSGKSLPKRSALPGLFLDLGRENVGRAL